MPSYICPRKFSNIDNVYDFMQILLLNMIESQLLDLLYSYKNPTNIIKPYKK